MGKEPEFGDVFESLIGALSTMDTVSSVPLVVDAHGEKFGHTYTKQSNFRDGVQFVFQFPNGFGASVIQSDMSYGSAEGKWELAVLKGEKLCYDTPITGDVIGWLSEEEVQELLVKIAALEEEKDELEPRD